MLISLSLNDIFLSKRKRSVNSELVNICNRYHKSIPLDSIFKICDYFGFAVIDEDGEPWEGLLTGSNGRCSIDLKDKKSGKLTDFSLNLQWYKMPSGNWEINAYLS